MNAEEPSSEELQTSDEHRAAGWSVRPRVRPGVRPIVAVVMLLACGVIAPDAAGLVPCKERRPESWDAEVADSSEPGDRLVVTGTVYRQGKPVPGVTVYVYHADLRGDYARRPNDPPRLCGIMLTDVRGRYRFRTIAPGGYGGYRGHIHYEAWGPGVRRQAFILELEKQPSREDSLSAPVFPGLKRFGPRGAGRGSEVRQRPVRGPDGVLRCTRNLLIR